MPKRIICNILYFMLIFSALWSEGAEFTFTSGEVEVQDPAEDVWFPMAGDELVYGETVVTGEGGQAELAKGGNIIKVAPETIFTLRESEWEGQRRDVFSCIGGEVKFKIQKVAGLAPEINSLSAVAGVRGTEFSVFAGADGTSLVVVTEGVVDVSASGESVVLQADEGVEVPPGSPPGEKFEVLRGQLDFKEWNTANEARIMEDPVGAVYRALARLEEFSREARKEDQLYRLNRLRLEELRDVLVVMKETKTREEVEAFYKEEIFPLEVETSYMRLNVRYWALSALSLRRYVLTSIYLRIKGAFIMEPGALEYRDFLYAYENALKLYEQEIMPFLVEADI